MEPLSPREKFEQTRSRFTKKHEDSLNRSPPGQSSFKFPSRSVSWDEQHRDNRNILVTTQYDNTYSGSSSRLSDQYTTMDISSVEVHLDGSRCVSEDKKMPTPDLNDSVVETDQEECDQYRRDLQRQSARIYERSRDIMSASSSSTGLYSTTAPHGADVKDVRRCKSFPNILLKAKPELTVISREPSVADPVHYKSSSLPRNTRSRSSSPEKYYRQISDGDYQYHSWYIAIGGNLYDDLRRRSNDRGQGQSQGHELRSDEIYPALDVSTDRIEVHHAVVKNIKTTKIPDMPDESHKDSAMHPVSMDTITSGSVTTSSFVANNNIKLDTVPDDKPDSADNNKKKTKRKGSRAKGIKKLRSILKKKGKRPFHSLGHTVFFAC